MMLYVEASKKAFSIPLYFPPRGGGGLPYETDGDARWKIRIKPLKGTNLGVATALFEP